jgi:hypothetical protein
MCEEGDDDCVELDVEEDEDEEDEDDSWDDDTFYHDDHPHGENGESGGVRFPAFGQRWTTTCPRCGGRGRAFHHHHRCPHCNGKRTVVVTESVTLVVPPGIPDGFTLVLTNKGEESPVTLPGDLIVRVNVLEHANFTRCGELGADLCTMANITLKEALHGFQRPVTHLGEGDKTSFLFSTKVALPGREFIIEGGGLPVCSEHVRVVRPEPEGDARGKGNESAEANTAAGDGDKGDAGEVDGEEDGGGDGGGGGGGEGSGDGEDGEADSSAPSRGNLIVRVGKILYPKEWRLYREDHDHYDKTEFH